MAGMFASESERFRHESCKCLTRAATAIQDKGLLGGLLATRFAIFEEAV
jgi:hypothetical protein